MRYWEDYSSDVLVAFLVVCIGLIGLIIPLAVLLSRFERRKHKNESGGRRE